MAHRFSPLALLTPVVALTILGACSDSSTSNNPPPNPNVTIPAGASLLTFTAFTPDTFTVPLGGAASVTVIWKNTDNITHTVTDTTAANAFNITLTGGKTDSVTFTAPGTFPYKCAIHTGMRGWIVVN
jgi:plastocyanin